MQRKKCVVRNHRTIPIIPNWLCGHYDDNLHYCGFIIWETSCDLFTFDTYPNILAIFHYNCFLFNYFDNSSFLSLSISLWWSWYKCKCNSQSNVWKSNLQYLLSFSSFGDRYVIWRKVSMICKLRTMYSDAF